MMNIFWDSFRYFSSFENYVQIPGLIFEWVFFCFVFESLFLDMCIFWILILGQIRSWQRFSSVLCASPSPGCFFSCAQACQSVFFRKSFPAAVSGGHWPCFPLALSVLQLSRWVFDSLGVRFCAKWETPDRVHSSVCGQPGFPAPFADDAFFSSAWSFGIFVKC